MDVWYYARNGQQQGPVPREELQRLLALGTVQPADYVWSDGMADWVPATQVPGLITNPPMPPASTAAGPSVAGAPGALAPVTNYLPWAIAATLCCCLPAGVMAIVYSARANSAQTAGRTAEAHAAADKARLWLLISVVLTLVGVVIQVVMLGAGMPSIPKLHP